MNNTCYVALSGGVDSAAAAVLLKEKGYSVKGITLRLKPDDLADADISDAEKVASVLGIPLTVLDMREEFKKITGYFCREYLAGRTPNPCVKCNPELKFGKMLEYVLDNGGDLLATGHYSDIIRDENGIYRIRRNPSRKDQSYFLCRLDQHILSHTIFPLSEYSKEDIRAIAARAGIPVADKKDSQEVCFIPDNDYVSYIERNFHPDAKPGDFVSADGKVLGKHEGIYKYTIGQRKGLGAFGKPMYVLSIDAENNRVIIGENEELFTDTVKLTDLSFLSGEKFVGKLDCRIKIRCAAKEADATLISDGTNATAVFETKQRAAAPGQTAAIYSGDILLGGATII